MSFKVSGRGAIAPFIVMDVMRAAEARQAAGGDVIHLEVGQPSTGAPAKVLEAARRALAADGLGYTLALGRESLRERIANHYRHAHGVRLPAERIAVTIGSSGAFLLAFLAAFDAGDRVAVAAPGYPAYRNILQALNIECVELPVGPATRFQLTVGMLEALDKPVDGVIVASPSNPTGSMIGPVELAELAAWCELKGIRLVSDEIYHGLTWGLPAATAADPQGHAIVVNSFSKYFAMTGWRLGWMVVPEDLARAVECLAQNMFISPPTLSQIAAEAAFDCLDELDERAGAYHANRDLLLDGLPTAGFTEFAPSDGAFYLYADVSHLTNDSDAFCKRILAETGVAVTPGIDFDPFEGRRTLRLSYAGSRADMEEAVRRLKAWRR